jgi:hypothetical protein
LYAPSCVHPATIPSEMQRTPLSNPDDKKGTDSSVYPPVFEGIVWHTVHTSLEYTDDKRSFVSVVRKRETPDKSDIRTTTFLPAEKLSE